MPPVRSRNFEFRGYDYWALGHIHARQVLCNDPLVVFAGNVQGRHIRETGPKGCLLATIHPDQRIEPVFQRLDQVRWERGCVDVSELETESEILGRAAEMFDGLLASEPDPDAMLAVRVSLSGTTSLARSTADRPRAIRGRGSQPGHRTRRRSALDREGRASDPPAPHRDHARRPV